jgi:hypothetical protein
MLCRQHSEGLVPIATSVALAVSSFALCPTLRGVVRGDSLRVLI